MGGDYYGGRDVEVTTSTSGYSDASASLVGVTSCLHSSMDPKRWANENLQCDNLDPIVFALDVTGSMGDWTKIIYDKMPMFYGQIMMQNYLKDPAISFCAIGDIKTDDAPLQVTEFGQGRAIDQLISKMYLEKGGGGNQHESYDLGAYFYSTHVDLLNPEFPFFFVTGDEGFWDKTRKSKIESLFGHGIKETGININAKKSWANLKEKFNVFHIKKPNDKKGTELIVDKQWKETLGSERVLHITEPKACIDVMLGAIALTSGSRTLEGYIKDMQTRGQDEKRINEVTNALKEYSEMLLKNEVKVVKYIINPLNLKNNVSEIYSEDLNNENKFSIKTEDLQEIQELVEKLLIEELDEVNNNYRQLMLKIKKEKSDSVPKEYLCPITREIMYDPVMTSDGHSFERTAIIAWLAKNDFSPMTGLILDSKTLLPNFALKQMIGNFVESS